MFLFRGIVLVCFLVKKKKVLWVVPFCFLCQPFSQVIIFIDWSEDTQYPEGPVDDHFKFRRNSLLLLLFCCLVDFGLFPYVRSLFEHFPEQSLLLSFLSSSLLTLLFSTALFLSILPPYSFILSFQRRMLFYLLQPMPLTASQGRLARLPPSHGYSYSTRPDASINQLSQKKSF